MKILTGLCTTIIALFFMNPSAYAESASPQQDSIDRFVNEATSSFTLDPHHTGLSIGILKDGVRHIYNFGSTSRSVKQLPNDHTIYEIASVTKTYTGILLAQAILDGKVGLDDAAQRYLDGDYSNLSSGGVQIKIVDLATHTAGLPRQIRAFKAGMTPAEIIASYGNYTQKTFLNELQKVKILTTPGVQFGYSNVDAQLIGIILERVYGKSYDDLVKQYITTPNHMQDTSTRVLAAKTHRAAIGYDGKGKRMPEMTFWRAIPAAGFLKSTVNDQLNYLQWNLDESNPSVALAHHTLFANTDEQGDDIALFWFTRHLPDGGREIRHAGGSFGCTSYEAIYPDAKIGIVLLANDADADSERALKAIADLIVANFH